jgi:hypothetical protein
MRQWGLHQGLAEDKTIGSLGFQKTKLIPDGTAAFTRGMGMSTLWTQERGFGERSWRYSMVVNNYVIEKMFVEQPKIQNSAADPFEVSDAETYVEKQFLYLQWTGLPHVRWFVLSVCWPTSNKSRQPRTNSDLSVFPETCCYATQLIRLVLYTGC